MRHRFGRTLAAMLAAGLVIAAPASAATLADWEMNEGPGAQTMVDSSGHVNGVIGSAVKTGVHLQGATAYQWPFTSPTAPPPKPERLVQVSSSTLNPGSGTYSVTMRYLTTKHFGREVHLCNVRLEEVLRVEIFRRGLHADAFANVQLRPSRGKSLPPV